MVMRLIKAAIAILFSILGDLRTLEFRLEEGPEEGPEERVEEDLEERPSRGTWRWVSPCNIKRLQQVGVPA
jgi:hypothetical protein